MRKRFPNSCPATLRDALYNMVHHSPIPAKVQAEELGMGYSYLCNAANPNLDSFDYQLRLLVPHTRITNNYAALDFIEEKLGRVGASVTRPPHALALRMAETGRAHDALALDLLAVAKELGEAADAVQNGLAGDGHLNESEARRCRKEVWDLVQRGAEVYQRLRDIEESCQ